MGREMRSLEINLVRYASEGPISCSVRSIIDMIDIQDIWITRKLQKRLSQKMDSFVQET